MAFGTDPSYLNFLSGLALIALALGVARMRPRRRANLAFAAFSAASGLAYVVWNAIDPGDALYVESRWVVAGFLVLAAGLLVRVAAVFPRPLAPSERPLALRAAGVGVLFFGLSTLAIASDATGIAASTRRESMAPSSLALFMVPVMLVIATLWATCYLLAQRFAATPPSERLLRRQYAFVCAALALYPGYVAGAGPLIGMTPLRGVPGTSALGLVGLATAVALALLWIRNASRAEDSAVARNLAWVCLAAPLLGLAFGAFRWQGGWGASRTLGVLLVGYAIVRLQLLDIDLKVKWTIKRGTLAAVFLAVFFIVAQVAQNFLSESYGLLLGGATAGLLLFAIAPLQRMAEHVADVAMPGVGETPAHRRSRAAEAYKFALRMALADKVVTREEERGLAALAEELGLPPTAALSLREEVEREAGVAPPAVPA